MPDLYLGFRFSVVFLTAGAIPNPLDIRFKKVSGLSAEVTTTTLKEGGQNLYSQKLPNGINYGNLILERGMVIGSLLNIEFNTTMSLYKFLPSNVLVTLHNEKSIPLGAWLFMKAYPVRWSTSDLDAEQESLVIDTMELAYSRMQIVRV